jgi:Putative transposase
MMDGVYEIRPNGAALFHPVPAPSDEEVAALVARVCRRVRRTLEGRGDEDGSGLAGAEPVLATLAGASVAGIAATGPRRGSRTLRLGSGSAAEATIAGR